MAIELLKESQTTSIDISDYSNTLDSIDFDYEPSYMVVENSPKEIMEESSS